MSDTDDFFTQMQATGAGKIATADLAEAARLAEQLRKVLRDRDEAKERADVLGKLAHHLQTTVIPEALAVAGVGGFTLTDGTQVSVADFVSGSLPKDPERREGAISALVDMGGADLIKTKVTVSFGRSGHNEAIALQHDLRAKGHAAELASDVHAQTLMAFAREKLKSGEPVDADKLGLFVGRTTKLKEPR